MTLRRNNLQSDSDLDSIRNSCDVYDDIDDSCKYVQFSDIWLMKVIRVSAHFLNSDFSYSRTTMVMIGMQKSDPWSQICELWVSRLLSIVTGITHCWELRFRLEGCSHNILMETRAKGAKAYNTSLLPFCLELISRTIRLHLCRIISWLDKTLICQYWIPIL